MVDVRNATQAPSIDLAATADFTLGALQICPARRLVHWRSQVRELEPRVMQVLAALAAARPNVVSRDTLVATCWGGRIVGDDSINRCILALRRLAKEVSPEPFKIETVPRVGYWLSEPATAGGRHLPPQRSLPAALRGVGRRYWTALTVALLLLAAITAALWDRGGTTGAAPVSLAVLPFRNLSAGEDYFAEGVAEEILAQLSREPEFRVVGRTSSWAFKGTEPDPQEVGRRLDVAHFLEGSVRTAGGRVRVNVALVEARDGTRLWSGSYDGGLDDIFAIQSEVGAAVAATLKRKLIYAAEPSGALRTSGHVYSLYLTARGLIRTREPQKARRAIALMRRAVELDPGYAPAWSSLGQAIRHGANDQPEAVEAAGDEAVRYVRHALRLAPNLAEAHGALGMLLGFETPEAAASIRRAAGLDPNNAELQFWLGNVNAVGLDFPAALAAWQRANELDPLLRPAGRAVVTQAADMNRRDIADPALQRIARAGDRSTAAFLGAYLTFFVDGDYSGAMAQAAAAEGIGEHWPWPRFFMAGVRRRLGLDDRGGVEGEFDAATRRVVEGKLPPIPEFRARLAKEQLTASEHTYGVLGLKRLLIAGRGNEVADLYDSGRLLDMGRAREVPPAVLVQNAPLVALVLRDAGREEEAARRLAAADRAIRTALRRGEVPRQVLISAAQIWALQGRHELALSAIERATWAGWVDSDDNLLVDIGDEPALRGLRGNARFERIRARLNHHIEKERREVDQLRI